MTSHPIRVFYSYSHSDEKLRDQLEKHLSILRRQGFIEGWHDRKIDAGENWNNEIGEHLNTAEIVLLLISPDFLASDFCYDVEMTRSLQRHLKGEARVIPIILRPTDWSKAPFRDLQALPKNAKPVTSWKNRDAAFENIARGIREVAEELQEIAEVLETMTAEGGPSSTPLQLVPRRIPAMEQLWNVHHFRNPRFIGRADILERIRTGFETNRNKVSVQVLCGLGGIGKSQIAIEFAYRQAEDYDVVRWIRAEDPTSLATDYASIAQELRLPEPVLKTKTREENEGNHYVGVVRKWLEEHKAWLLIFDNANDLPAIREYIPRKGSGHILVTSRNPTWRGISEPIPVER